MLSAIVDPGLGDCAGPRAPRGRGGRGGDTGRAGGGAAGGGRVDLTFPGGFKRHS